MFSRCRKELNKTSHNQMDPTIFDNNARKQIKKIDKGQKKVSIDSFQRY